MNRFHSIRMRILGGFLAMLLLQVGVAVAVWQAENQLDRATAAGHVAETAAQHVGGMVAALRDVQLRLNTYLRTRSANDHQSVDQALKDLEAATSQTANADAASDNLVHAIQAVRPALDAVMQSALAKVDASMALVQVANDGQNGLFALSQAAPRLPERATVEAIAGTTSAAIAPISAASRYAFNDDVRDASSA
jgi:CHASE3 domain sensor protein